MFEPEAIIQRENMSEGNNKLNESEAKHRLDAPANKPAMTVSELKNIAVQLHTAGHLSEAENVYQKILHIDPSQPTALHLLGVISHQVDKNEDAVDLISRAIAVKPNFPEALNNLGAAQRALGLNEDAILSYEKALSYKPDYVDAHFNLAGTLYDMSRFNEAAASYRRALAFNSEQPSAHYNLGALFLLKLDRPDKAIIHFQKSIDIEPKNARGYVGLGNAFTKVGKLNDAALSYQKAHSIKPSDVSILYTLGHVLQELDNLEDAVSCYNSVLDLEPDNADAYFDLGKIFHTLGQLEGAVENYQNGLRISPGIAEAHCNLGLVFEDLSQMNKALECYQKAVKLKPDLIPALYNIAHVLQNQKQLSKAISAYKVVLDIDPNFIQALSNLGVALNDLGKLSEAISCFRSALLKQPDYADGYNNLANALLNSGDPDAAIDCYKKAIECRPDFADAHSNLLMTEHYRIGNTAKTLYPIHCEWDQSYGQIHKAVWPQHKNRPNPDRPLRIGFVSADLGRHPVGYFVVGLLENLRDFQFETYCYSDRIADDLTDRIKASTDVWRDIRGSSNEIVASLVLSDSIDILIDLTGHSANSRLLVFARKPAPVQVAWAGYVGTTGVSAIDYLISDRFSTHPNEEQYYSEKILRMPNQWLCYDPPSYAPDVGSLPLKRNGYVTFGSFSNPGKLNADVVSVWAKILHAVEGARLLIKYRHIDEALNIERLTKMFEAEGVAPNRLILEGRSPHVDLLARYNDVDIGLDPFPYSGGVTTYEALWMGVPVITVPGNTFASRHSLSHLTTVGHPEFVADNQEHYVELATRLARDESRLLEIRSGLRKRMTGSPICDHRKFSENFSLLMRGIWCEWCHQQENGVKENESI